MPEGEPSRGNARRGLFDDFAMATAVLTRLPVGNMQSGPIAAAGWAFPLVGAGVGALCAVTFFVAGLAGLPELPSALLAVFVGLVITGAFHEDGLADTVDGFAGGRNRDDKLAIMRDSRHGTFGILALVLSVGLRAAAVAGTGDPIHAGLALIAAHAVSRGVLPLFMRLLRPARADGLGAAAGRPSVVVAAISVLAGMLLALAMLGLLMGVVALLLAAAALALGAVLAYRQIGGYTGDVLGFFQQIGEVVMLLVAAAR